MNFQNSNSTKCDIQIFRKDIKRNKHGQVVYEMRLLCEENDILSYVNAGNSFFIEYYPAEMHYQGTVTIEREVSSLTNTNVFAIFNKNLKRKVDEVSPYPNLPNDDAKTLSCQPPTKKKRNLSLPLSNIVVNSIHQSELISTSSNSDTNVQMNGNFVAGCSPVKRGNNSEPSSSGVVEFEYDPFKREPLQLLLEKVNGKRLYDDAISHYVSKGAYRPTHIGVFPQKQQGKRLRRFNPSWYSNFWWLEYSQETNEEGYIRDCCFCLPCYVFSGEQGCSKSGDVFVDKSQGFSNWDAASRADKGILSIYILSFMLINV